MKNANCRMITLARESRGLTQTKLAEQIYGLDQGNLSKIEKGILKISDNTLCEIANKLNYPVSFFYKSMPTLPIHSFYYRKRITIPKKVSMVFEAQIDIIRNVVGELLSSIDIPDYNLPNIDINEIGSPKDAARHIRTMLKINKGPVINLISILENNGIIVYFLDADTKFDGITVFTDDGTPIIIVNNKMPNDRKRFTIGHELGHLVMHIPFTHFRDSDEVEREANQFSSEFSMPENECRNDLLFLKYNNLGHLKDYWKLSKAAIIYRAKEIGVINDKTCKYLNIELSRRGERKRETGNVFLDRPKIISELIRLHKNELGYSLNELTDLLSINSKDFDQYFNPLKSHLRIA